MKISLIITTFNRPEYLRECFRSIKHADIPNGTAIYIVDDGSTSKETIDMVYKFEKEGCNVMRLMKGKNAGIKDSLKLAFDLAYDESDIMINLDGDAIVRKDFIKVLTVLKKMFPDNIVSGFNTTVLNRNPIISEHNVVSKKEYGFFKKRYASGINMVINKEEYAKYIQPSLQKPGNWDFNSSLLHEADGKVVIVAKPSVVQHIGINSAMGHAISEPPDLAEDFFIQNLPNVTLIGASSSDLSGLIHAADRSSKYIQFGEVKLLSSLPSNDPRVVTIKRLGSKAEYNQFVLKELADYISTDYCLIIQGDGYVLNPYSWRNEFLDWDYIGAVWNFDHLPYPGYNVGNGGFSLRTKKLHRILKADNLIRPTNDAYIKNFEEDHNICKIYRNHLESNYKMKFAPVEVANKFSIEAYGLKYPANLYNDSFGFHGTCVDFSECDLEHVPSI